MQSWQLSFEELGQQLDSPLGAELASIVCGDPAALNGEADGLQIVWVSDVEPRVLAGLPFGLALAVTNRRNLRGWQMPRVAGAQTLSENLQRLWSRRDWESGCVLSECVRPPLTPPVPISLSRWESWLLTQVPQGTSAAQRLARVSIEAGARLLADDLDGSHQCAQSIEGEGGHRTGDYWHAIMHRREPDYSNSRYWFRRVGSHPAFQVVAQEMLHLLETATDAPPFLKDVPHRGWRPEAMLQACESMPGNRWLTDIQYREMLVLYRFSCDEYLGAQ